MAATVSVPAIGSFRLGGYALGGTPASGGGAGGGGGTTYAILALEANDRHQVVALINNGTSVAPKFVYWNPEPAPWSEALTFANPSDYPPFFAVDGAGAYPDAIIESPVFEADDDQAIALRGVYVKFIARPTVMDSYDGGDGGTDPFFTIKARGWGVAGVTLDGADTLDTQIVETATPITVTVADNDVSASRWPSHRTAWCPVGFDQEVTAYQIVVTACYGVEFVEFRGVGVRRARRSGA